MKKPILSGLLVALLIWVLWYGNDLRVADGFGDLGLIVGGIMLFVVGAVASVLFWIMTTLIKIVKYKKIFAFLLGSSFATVVFGLIMFLFGRLH
ncbi:MAG: hypothetical protein KW806_01605 [Candidatus Yanofskybacteria bacterium]|nr:hypothetical protein [Candidatus Yanofskybacteria bacterium]